ncbi:Heavy metal-associated domain, HMA [Artemisia annua]|uniref:Heavy metal-associated domain, HMA n=1 Tax=Artemisia annua TaxID=35608 RepID=A0A2U1KCH2_ARTAN|nr:Heavy metal-associated domain, HMA [Artemisia annua]
MDNKNRNKNNNPNANENANAKTEEQHENNQEENKNEAGALVGDENAKGSESPTKDNKQNDNKQNAGAIVLGVYLHCQGCVETVVKSLRGFEGVEVVEPNTKDNRVVVKGKNCDPVRIAERVRRKSGKHVEIISPVQKKQQEKKQEKKPEAPKVTETVLKMHLHCDGCCNEVKRIILKLAGVQSVNPDMNASTVTVKGTVDPKDLIAFIRKKAGRHAEVVVPKKQKGQNQNQNDGEQKDNEKKDKGKDGKNIGLSYPNVPPGLVYAPQIFSDENPNACHIM